MTIPGYHNYSFALPLLREYKQQDPPILYDQADQYDSFEDWPWLLLYKEFEARRIVYGHEMPYDHKEDPIKQYLTHYEVVIRHFAGRHHHLLTICRENGDGWNKLCPFLKADFPSLPFPHMNRTRIPSVL